MTLKSTHIDSGTSRGLFDVTGKPIEGSDAKEARTLASYDQLQRPVNAWSQNNASDTLRLTAHAIYGEAATDPKNKNLLGQAWQQYDESGKTETVAFDFKGNLLSKKQYVISSVELKAALDNYNTYLVDWTGLPNILGTQVFETSSEFDALNRATKITLPENVNTDRKEIVPTYNRAGALEKVDYDGTQYVENIAYNAKGQRLLIAFGNQIMTRYVYNNRTFRLERQKSEKYTFSQVGDTLIYTPDSGNKKQDNAFNYDLIGNILKILNRVTDCGIQGVGLGSDALDRDFTYDPLYRLTSATGRESDTQEQNDYLYSNAPIPGSPNASNVRAYERKYSFDKLGNILKMQQLGTGNSFTRNFNYAANNNKLADVKTGSDALIQDFTYDAAGNQLTAGNNRHYDWNAANMMICYKNQTGSSNPTIFAQYDYAGQNRVSKMIRTGTDVSPIYERTIYIDGIFEYHILENGTTYEKNYVHVMDDTSRIAMVRIGDQFPDDISESITYNLEDQVGSSTVRLSSNGSVIDKQEYYPFGDSSLRTFTKKRYQYTGKEKDAESGLYYYGARYYAAWTCRFTSTDPLQGDYPHFSTYSYAFNNPLAFNDPTGMEGEKASASADNISTDGGGNELSQQEANSGGEIGDTYTDTKGLEFEKTDLGWMRKETISESEVAGVSYDINETVKDNIQTIDIDPNRDKIKPEMSKEDFDIYSKQLFGAASPDAPKAVDPKNVYQGGEQSLFLRNADVAGDISNYALKGEVLAKSFDAPKIKTGSNIVGLAFSLSSIGYKTAEYKNTNSENKETELILEMAIDLAINLISSSNVYYGMAINTVIEIANDPKTQKYYQEHKEMQLRKEGIWIPPSTNNNAVFKQGRR